MTEKGLEFIEIPVVRTEKPREEGITFVFEFGMSFGEAQDLIESSGEYIDLIKLAVLSIKLQPRDLVEKKIKLYKDHQIDVFPGGMALEAAVLQRKVEQFFDEIKELGCTAAEVSTSKVSMPLETKNELVKMGAEKYGLKILGEIGPKTPNAPFIVSTTVNEAKSLLNNGAWKIILEGEVFEFMSPEKEKVAAERYIEIVDRIGVQNVILEGPPEPEGPKRVPAHQWLVSVFGPNVNVGNVNCRNVIELESIRRGMTVFPWLGSIATL